MRIMFGLLLAMATTFAVDTASAQNYPWCAQYSFRGGATNCGFATLQQCQWAVSGNGGFCFRNLFYTGSHGDAPSSRSRQRKQPG